MLIFFSCYTNLKILRTFLTFLDQCAARCAAEFEANSASSPQFLSPSSSTTMATAAAVAAANKKESYPSSFSSKKQLLALLVESTPYQSVEM